MMVVTHTVMSVALTSVAMGTADPIVLGLAAIASQMPDVDTSKSVPGRLLFPVSHWLEKRFPHRSITHSFFASGLFALLSIPVILWSGGYWEALVLGYFLGWFGDVFTKSGVTAFYPSSARLVIPGNPRLRLSTNSPAELFVLGVLVLVAIASITINSGGGILRGFNQILGMPSGAVEIINNEGHQYLLSAHVRGIWQLTNQPVDSSFEVVKSLTQSDLLVKDSEGRMYRAGSSQECQILANQVQVERGPRINATSQELFLNAEDIAHALQGIQAQRAYVSGTLNLDDAQDIQVIVHPQQFASITIQPAEGMVIAHLESANPAELVKSLGDYVATGSIIVRSIHVQS
jgi:inner membrane protein